VVVAEDSSAGLGVVTLVRVNSRSRSDATATAMAQLPLPDRIGRYQVIDRLATGGMAEVFVCIERQLAGLERFVVVKRILPQLAVQESFVEMFLAEARYVARITHPHVVQIYELGEDRGLPYLSMEYVPGCSLRDLLVAAIRARAPLPPGVAVGLAVSACAGAHAAHELADPQGRPLGLVHRDISPHNLMVTVDGHVKLLDFGIAKATHESAIDHTRTGTLKGKVHYMAPEQCRQEPLDRRADVFALGVVLWELLSGERLFKRDSELEAMQAIVSGDVRDLRRIRKDLPPALIAVVEQALATKRESRFATADLMRRALLEAVRDFDVSTEAIAAFVQPLVGASLETRRLAFSDAAHKKRAVPESTATRTKSRSMSIASDEEGESTMADTPGAHRALHTEYEPIAGDVSEAVTIQERGPPAALDATQSPARSSSLAVTTAVTTAATTAASQSASARGGSPSSSSASLPSAPRRRVWPLALAVAGLSCVAVLAVLLAVERVPRLFGPATRGPPLRIAWPPTVEPQTLQAELSGLDRLLEEATQRPIEIKLQPTYDAVVDALADGSAEFGVLPPFLFVSARHRLPGLVPLATKLIDGSAGSDGVIFVRDESDVQSIADLKGRTFCYPDVKSTTGYLLPRAAMRAAGLDPDVDVVAHLSGNHTQVIKDIASNVCVAGATYSGGYLAADRAGIQVGQIRQLAITGRSPQDMVVASPTAPSADRAVFGAALLSLDPKRSLGQDAIGTLERISGFTVPRLADYDALEKLVPPPTSTSSPSPAASPAPSTP
jgi:phosphate/phosphite/phosphonate ABC transporter binding protein